MGRCSWYVVAYTEASSDHYLVIKSSHTSFPQTHTKEVGYFRSVHSDYEYCDDEDIQDNDDYLMTMNSVVLPMNFIPG